MTNHFFPKLITNFSITRIGDTIYCSEKSRSVPAFEQLNNYIDYSKMAMPTSNYWNVVYGTDSGESSPGQKENADYECFMQKYDMVDE
ncbi:hypothetical protein [Clostridium luticellarii]|uniref:hypothetical protein n=1 Tax=Clostridium luticellarii TaxID=1691940 RepID=UPI000D022800|nr:hypothetical protein [Clostridium luticellarii]